jgi:dTDP-4-dehydrorhamnose 3,5-epimerase-like enzyme
MIESTPTLSFKFIGNTGDKRGFSFTIDKSHLNWLRTMPCLHVVSIRPGFVRGNHYHLERHEVLFVSATSRWVAAWSIPGTSEVTSRSFEAQDNIVAIEVPPGLTHAVRNEGSEDLTIIAFSDVEFDPANPDAVREVILEPLDRRGP